MSRRYSTPVHPESARIRHGFAFPAWLTLFTALLLVAGCSTDEPSNPALPEAPTIQVIAPPVWSVLSGNTQVTVIAPNAETVQLWLGDQMINESGSPFHLAWDTSILPNGHHRPRIVALNRGGEIDSTTDVVTDNPGRGVAVVAPVTEVSIGIGGAVLLGVIVVGDDNHAVTWSIEEQPDAAARGTVEPNGLYSAPPHVPDPEAVVLIATSVADAAKTAHITVHVMGVSVQVDPAAASVELGASRTFAAHVYGTEDQGVAWEVVGSPERGTVTAEGVYNAPLVLPDPPTAMIRATSTVDPGRSATATVTIVPPPPPVEVSVSPAEANVVVGDTKRFTATVIHAADTRVAWSVTSGAGTIDDAGLYLAPAALPEGPSVTITATSLEDPSRSASAAVTLVVRPPIMVSVSPAQSTIIAGTMRRFHATVSNSGDARVTWSVTAGAGTIDYDGLYVPPSTVPEVAGVTVTATSVANPAISGSADITIVSSAPLPGNLDSILALLTETGNQAALLCDQSLNLVVMALDRARQANHGTLTTVGTLRFTDGEHYQYEPPSPGQTTLILAGSGPQIELTVTQLQTDWLHEPFQNRLFGSDFRGTITARLVIQGVADLDIAAVGQPGTPDYLTSFERTIEGDVVMSGVPWAVNLTDTGDFEESFHVGDSRHHLSGALTIGGTLVTMDDVIGVSYGEFCYGPGGFTLRQERRYASTLMSDGYEWALNGDVQRLVDLNCGFYERVYGLDSWKAEGELTRDGAPAGTIAFDGPLVLNTDPPVAGVMLSNRPAWVLSLPKWYIKVLPNPFTPGSAS